MERDPKDFSERLNVFRVRHDVPMERNMWDRPDARLRTDGLHHGKVD